ncbi:hypothetical protein VFPPC_15227 [Pochonia chlamydosporia 170]|uniref:Uncharacterized protein n=1 Tax=Pochonia chlamydosporia 170 TaxID=1380566 RepID=A0A179G639_METCM|nr:hypothetical protein VFPPC_15227 [Pochonia chlamydosporia 170]OAQ72968.1 hypothetical protein VFPPC_15227 [Pochonia chlamydosporia 170]
MRDRQARGKNPYKELETDDIRLGRGVKTEPFEDRERRGFALSVLDNPEQLMMYAQSMGDSVPGQRLRFMAMLCGFEEKKHGHGHGHGHAGKERDKGRR